MLAIADMTPPAITSKFSKPAPVASSTWLVNFMDTAPVAEEGGWWLLRSCEEFAVDGYQSQMMEVWGRHGRLVCNSRQLVALYAVNDLASARFLWKRIPPGCKADPELVKLWDLGKYLLTRKYGEMFHYLESICEPRPRTHTRALRRPRPSLTSERAAAPSLSPLSSSVVARFVSASPPASAPHARPLCSRAPGWAQRRTGSGRPRCSARRTPRSRRTRPPG